MSGTVRQMLTCHWSAQRIQRYLDADPAAPLTPGEVALELQKRAFNFQYLKPSNKSRVASGIYKP